VVLLHCTMRTLAIATLHHNLSVTFSCKACHDI